MRAIVGHEVKGAATSGRRRAARTGGAALLGARRERGRRRSRTSASTSIAGEILALGGLVGSGRTEVARLAFGVDRLEGGHFEIEGKPVAIENEARAIALGIALVPEERRSQGLMLEQSVGFNINIASLRGAPLARRSAVPLVAEERASRRSG